MGSRSGYLKGLQCEDLALAHYQKLGFTLVSRRLKTPFSEVDLLLKKNDEVLMVEVKSAPRAGFELGRLGTRQRQRLLRAFFYLNQKHKNLRFEIAFVNLQQQKINSFDGVCT